MQKKRPFQSNYNNRGYTGNNSYNRQSFRSYSKDGQRDFRSKYSGPDKNYYIRAEEVRVIDDEGNNLGVMKTADAIRLAQDKGIDLVEIGKNAQPPVCKIIDFSKYLYEQKKKLRSSKRTESKEMKEFRFSPVIEQHDIDIRVKRAKGFLARGHNVRLSVTRKGRQAKEQVMEMMSSILTYFDNYSTIESVPKEDGKKTFITIKCDGKAENKKNSGETNQDVES